MEGEGVIPKSEGKVGLHNFYSHMHVGFFFMSSAESCHCALRTHYKEELWGK